MSLQDFIKVMLHHLPETRDRVGLVKNLIELFRQIDVNGDEQLDWDEFTGHIIEMGKCIFALFFVISFLIIEQEWCERTAPTLTQSRTTSRQTSKTM